MVQQRLELLLHPLQIGLGRFELIAEDTRTGRASPEGYATTDGPCGGSEQFLSGASPLRMRSHLVQHLTQSDDVGLRNGWCAGRALQQGQGSRACWISKPSRKLGEEHRQQGVDLVLVAHHIIAELLLETDQFPIRGHRLDFGHSQNGLRR